MTRRGFSLLTLAALSIGTIALAQDGYTDTPFLPGNKWRVHDKMRPQPPVVSPGPYQGWPVPAPADATVLFDGTNTSKWTKNWRIDGDSMIAGGGDNTTRDSFGDMQLHLEFATPFLVKGNGQGRGNSGVIIQGRYEIQVLDNYNNPTYADGTVGSVYGQYPPLVNASRKPGEWQTYDIYYTAPRFDTSGKLTTPAYVTVILNGILVQNHSEILWPVAHRNTNKYTAHGPAPLLLQDHGNPVRYRNIWVRPLDATKAP